MNDLKTDVLDFGGHRYAFPHDKCIIIRNMQNVIDLDIKNVVQIKQSLYDFPVFINAYKTHV